MVDLAQDGVYERAHIGAARLVLIEATVGADPVAERDVDVEVAEHRTGATCTTYRRPILENYEKALGGELLAGVSRSFYLSLKVTPKRTRGTVGLMYLLARATDTIADTAGIAVESRVDFLDRFEALIQGDRSHEQLQTELRSEFCPQQEHQKERELLSRVGECLDWLRAIGKPQAAAIRKVLATIVHGQRLDLQRFDREGVNALATAAELEEYTYLVAGCVGEF